MVIERNFYSFDFQLFIDDYIDRDIEFGFTNYRCNMMDRGSYTLTPFLDFPYRDRRVGHPHLHFSLSLDFSTVFPV